MKNVVCSGSEFVFSVQVKKHSKTIKYSEECNPLSQVVSLLITARRGGRQSLSPLDEPLITPLTNSKILSSNLRG